MAKVAKKGTVKGKGKAGGSAEAAVGMPSVRKAGEAERVSLESKVTGTKEAVQRWFNLPPKHKGPFVVLDQKGIGYWADQEAFGWRTVVLFRLIALSEFGNLVHFKRSDLAKHLGMDPRNLRRILDFLYDRYYLIRMNRHKAVTGTEVAKINAFVVWKGNPRKLEEEQRYLLDTKQLPGMRKWPVPPARMANDLDMSDDAPIMANDLDMSDDAPVEDAQDV